VGAVFNPGAIKFNDEVLLLVRVEDRQEYIITCVSFFEGVTGEPPGISMIATRDFLDFKRLGQQLMPPNKNASLFPETFKGYFALINRPIFGGRADIWVSFSMDLNFWGRDRVLIPARGRAWDSDRVGLGPPPIKTPDGWLIIYHRARNTASGSIYRVGLALLDLETLELIYRSRDWVLGPKESYERVGDVDDVVFPCGAVVDKKTNELLAYYGAADSVVALAIADLDDILTYLKEYSY
jgi:beta-1,4-mannooligosaccharide/beta-1,4-mannosyl-N-acetylglucosamine phosphorylase